MTKVIMESWRYGLEKVSLTKLQYEKLGMSLKDSKTNTDMLLDDNVIILEIEDENVVQEFLKEADRIGVNCKILE
ncbi:hypothetical protein [Flavobacterium sp.]|jgi:hypothetical protein|uniref:hypothetical protein n=1 Tax=Flavobacterium sp. TaxID=239 RepID=UPI00374D541D